MNLSMTEQQYAMNLNFGVEWAETTPLLPEAVTFRVLVQDRATSKIGSLIVPIADLK